MCVGLAFPLSYLVQPQQRVGRAVVLQQQHAPTRPNHAPHRPQRLQASMDGAWVWSIKAPVRFVVGPLSTPLDRSACRPAWMERGCGQPKHRFG
jgi:hypothetical protein